MKLSRRTFKKVYSARRTIQMIFVSILIVGIFGPALALAERFVFSQNSQLPRTTYLYPGQADSRDNCTVNLFLHGHRQAFDQDPIRRLALEQSGVKSTSGILVVPNLMSRCRKGCRSKDYDRFSFESYLQSLKAFLKSKGLCQRSIKSINILGHSGAYLIAGLHLLPKLIDGRCQRPNGLLQKVNNVVLFDALYYGAGNRTMRRIYRNFTDRVKACDSTLKFAHYFRKVANHSPHRNSCDLDCNFKTEISLNQKVQMISAAKKYNPANPGHWNMVKDTLPIWLKLFE